MVLWVSFEGSVRALGGAPQEEAEAQTWGWWGESEGRAGEPTCRAAGISTRPTPSAPRAGYLVGAVGKTPRGT